MNDYLLNGDELSRGADFPLLACDERRISALISEKHYSINPKMESAVRDVLYPPDRSA